jgi:TetR/AcrR family transcriptional regulator, transcriptional repressor for nem operon
MSRRSLRDDILRAGLRVMFQSGYHQASVRDICAAARAPQGSFTNHFRSKEAFAVEVLDQYFDYLKGLVSEALNDETLTPRQRLKRYLDVITDKLERDRWIIGCLIGDLSLQVTSHSKLLRKRLDSIFREWRKLFASCIAAAQSAGEIDSKFDATELAEFLLASWEGAILRMKVERSRAALERFKAIMFETVFQKPQASRAAGHKHGMVMRRPQKTRFRSHMVTLVTACLLVLTGTVHADHSSTQQNSADGKVTRDGIDLFYKVVGPTSGDYVLVLSGGPGEDIDSMQGIADELGKKYRCIMWEQRGTGRSKLPQYDPSRINLNAYIEDIEALRKQLHAEKFIVVGNSWGMILGLAYAGTYPDAVRAVVTIGSGPITFEYLGVFSDNQLARLGACELEVRDFWRDPSREAANPDHAAFERLRAATVAYFYDRKKALQMAAELKPEDYNFRVPPAFLEAEGKYDFRPKLKTIVAPVLLLQGRQDLAGEANVDEAHSLIKNSTLTFIDKCGHMPWLEQPEQTWKIVEDFLVRLP